MISFQDIVLQRGKKVLLDEASARIERGNRVGLIGRNGAGKSSLMSVMIGESQEDAGNYHCEIKPDRIAHLEQSLPNADLSAIEFAKSGDKQWFAIQHQLMLAEENADGMKIAEYHAKLHDIDGYTIDARAATILHGLGFSQAQLTQPISHFSGGWQMRLQLAKVLLSRADLLLLDEPTNHLDLEAIAWFEKWLLSQTCSVILISHDRDFLDNVCTQILHLSQQKLKLYSGNYTDFMRQFELQLELEAKQRDKVIRQKAHMQKFVDRFRFKASKARQAQSRLKAIEKLNVAPGLQQENPFHFSFLPTDELSSPILKIEGSTGYGEKPILSHLNLSLTAEDRIGVIGLNGAGKSTLIKTIAAVLPLISGEITQHNKLKIGYFSQQQLEALDYDNTPLAHVLKHHPRWAESEARKFLGGFNFQGDRVFDRVGDFSGGEKSRLALALLIADAPNILLLDEPTNHLDIQMREALIFALQSFNGAVLLVSHDRYFVNSVVDSLWLVAHGSVKQYVGNLEDYQDAVLQMAPLDVSEKKSVVEANKNNKPQKAANPQKLKKLESEIESLSKRMQEIDTMLAESDIYQAGKYDELIALQAESVTVSQRLIELEDQWLDMNS